MASTVCVHARRARNGGCRTGRAEKAFGAGGAFARCAQAEFIRVGARRARQLGRSTTAAVITACARAARRRASNLLETACSTVGARCFACRRRVRARSARCRGRRASRARGASSAHHTLTRSNETGIIRERALRAWKRGRRTLCTVVARSARLARRLALDGLERARDALDARRLRRLVVVRARRAWPMCRGACRTR